MAEAVGFEPTTRLRAAVFKTVYRTNERASVKLAEQAGIAPTSHRFGDEDNPVIPLPCNITKHYNQLYLFLCCSVCTEHKG